MANSRAVRVRFWAITIAIVVIVAGGVMTLVGFGDPSDGAYGQLPLPGSTLLHLPSGQVDIVFTEDLDNQTVDEPAVLHISVTPSGGGAALPVTVVPDGGSVGINGVTHTYWGYLKVPQAGDYRVNVPDDISPSIPNPQLLFGPDSAPQEWILLALAIAAALVIVAIVAHRVVRRNRRDNPGTPSQPRPESGPRPDTVPAWLYVTGVNGAPPPLVGLGPVRVSGEIRRDPAGVEEPRIPVLDHELTAPTAHWPQVGATLAILLSRNLDDGESVNFVVLWEVPAASHD
ncbi:MAG TPA: hypothetical protein VGM75_34290 [Pseudonocardiaceae bacterium]